MKEEIMGMIAAISSKNYDPEEMHSKYDDLLEKFILNYDIALIDYMKKLISLEKDFWYA